MQVSRLVLDGVIGASLAGMVLVESRLIRGLLVVPVVLAYQLREIVLLSRK